MEHLADLSMEYEDKTGNGIYFGFYKIEGELERVSICVVETPFEPGHPPSTHCIENVTEEDALAQIRASLKGF